MGAGSRRHFVLVLTLMPAITATAPGKVILFGEHAVVYGQPAIAAPVWQVQARAVVTPELRGPTGSVHLEAPDIGLDAWLSELPPAHPLVLPVRLVLDQLKISQPPALRLRIVSTIPVASGLGSGAAVAIASLRALSGFLGRRLTDEQVSRMAFEVEKLHHGTPSGIDNTVIAFGRPVFFQRSGQGEHIETFRPAARFSLLIADTGIPSPTSSTVGDVRRAWREDPERFEGLFEEVGRLVREARQAIEAGPVEGLGLLMDRNHGLLQAIGVSSAELDGLALAARQAGALGAKLSGGGRGGNLIALVTAETADSVDKALLAHGARRTILTTIK